MSDIETRYQEALDYLYGFVDFSLTRQLRYSPEKFNLVRMRSLMELMGNPQYGYPVIHVAGTKGKGSTSAMISSILMAAGYKVGLYTSPHLQDYVERIQLNGKPINHNEMVELVEKIRPFVQQVDGITTFEITTALGFQAFYNARVDLAVVEVGLGGRLDATNIINPLVSVITSLSMDHMNILGDTLAKIAAEKGGIIKPGRPVVLSPQLDEAREVIREICEERGSELIEVEKEFVLDIMEHSLDGQNFLIRKISGNEPEPHSYFLPLLGAHQVTNAATAYAAIDVIGREGFNIHPKDIENGFREVSWSGRFEVVSRDPLIIIDSAHNQDSAQKLSQAIRDYLPGYEIILVFGASEDKDVDSMFEYLLPLASMVIATRSIHPRAAEPNILVELARKRGKMAISIDTMELAVKEALLHMEKNKAVVITGSIFVAAAAREILLKNDLLGMP